uniref:VWFC domain-containing protein n=1 Tax=Cuerna arida TaxID=1464854 RepID=A0A1B6G149_9HEMI
MDYDVTEDGAFGPGTCRYGGKVYVSAQQIPRDDPCDFCFCFRSDIICLQQSCPPPIHRCHQEPIQGYCCPRYQCPVSMATSLNLTTTTTTTTTTLPPHFFAHAYQGAARHSGCLHRGRAYNVGEEITTASGPCLQCICGADGQMKCDPVVCSPEPMLRKMMEAAISHRRR